MGDFCKSTIPARCTALVKKHWRDVWHMTREIKFSKEDEAARVNLFDLIAHYVEVRSQWIESGSRATIDAGDKVVKNPELAILIQLQQAMTLTLKEFGATPLARARLNSIASDKEGEEDDLSKFLKKREKTA